MSNIRHSIGRPSNVEYSTSEALFFGFFRFDRPYSRMSNIQHPKHPSSDVVFSTFDQPSVECRIFDIRNTLLRKSNIRHSTEANIGSKIESFSTPLSISVIGLVEKCAQLSHFWFMCFILMKLTSQIREMWIGIICIIGQTRIHDGWELYHFNIRGPLIADAALSVITSLVHIFLKAAWLGKFTQTFCKTYCLN